MNRTRASVNLMYCLVIMLAIQPVLAGDGDEGYLTSSEIGAIFLGTGTILVAGNAVRHNYEPGTPKWIEPTGLERSLSRWLGGRPKPGPDNFMDTDRAALFSILTTGALIISTDLAYPRHDRTRDVLQNQYLYFTGALVNKGINDFVKGSIARLRPMSYFYPEMAQADNLAGTDNAQHSFYSGHASSAFFSMTFLNHRLRDAMRQEMTAAEFNDWGWVSSTVTYGWATFVALSRIHAYKHYLFDVLAGAVMGFLIGEVFYGLADDVEKSTTDNSNKLMVKVTLPL